MQRPFLSLKAFGITLLAPALGLLALQGPTSAQNAAPTPPPRTVQVGVVQISREPLPPMFVRDMKDPENRVVPLPVARYRRGATLEVPIGDTVEIFTSKTGSSAPTDLEPLFSFKVPNDQERALLLLYVDTNGEPGHVMVDDSEAAHSAGMVRLINVSNQPITFVAGQQRREVPAGGEAKVTPQLDEDRRFEFLFRSFDGEGEVFTSNLRKLKLPKPETRLLILYTALPRMMPVDDQFKEDGSPMTQTVFVPTAYRLYDEI